MASWVLSEGSGAERQGPWQSLSEVASSTASVRGFGSSAPGPGYHDKDLSPVIPLRSPFDPPAALLVLPLHCVAFKQLAAVMMHVCMRGMASASRT
jgi:hypothetical protein